MAEEKAFEPTQGRVERAKREGDVPRSSELAATVSFACAALGTVIFLPLMQEALQSAMFAAMRENSVPWNFYAVLFRSVIGTMVCGIVGSIAVTFLQAGRVNFRFPSIKIEKLNPVQGLQRMFSGDALLLAAKACIVAAVTTSAMFPCIHDVFTVTGQNEQILLLVIHSLEMIMITVICLGIAFGVIDVFFERSKWMRRLRMNFDEIKREQRHSEGDPHLRNRRKQMHKHLLRGSISRLRDAAFVVVNPMHIAIALEYHPPEVEVPRVIMRAIDRGAELVKQRARELSIPIVENVALARFLLETTQVGSYIPQPAYVTVANIVASLSRKRHTIHES